MGTVHLLEALRQVRKPCAAVVVTTDKCYENREWVHSYREEDPMGATIPTYSSSKGAAELVVSAFRRSYFNSPDCWSDSPRVGPAMSSVGAIGRWTGFCLTASGPCGRARRSPSAISGHAALAARAGAAERLPLAGGLPCPAGTLPVRPVDQSEPGIGFNFGPALGSNQTVAGLVQEVLKHWPGRWEDRSDPQAVHEAKLLNLATDKAHHLLGWSPVWAFPETIAQTVGWYRAAEAAPGQIPTRTAAEIHSYTTAARARGVVWAAA